MVAKKGWQRDKTQARGQAVWLVYAVLHAAANDPGLPRVDVDGNPVSIFELAAFQRITAKIKIDDDGAGFTMEIAGRSPVDA